MMVFVVCSGTVSKGRNDKIEGCFDTLTGALEHAKNLCSLEDRMDRLYINVTRYWFGKTRINEKHSELGDVMFWFTWWEGEFRSMDQGESIDYIAGLILEAEKDYKEKYEKTFNMD